MSTFHDAHSAGSSQVDSYVKRSDGEQVCTSGKHGHAGVYVQQLVHKHSWNCKLEPSGHAVRVHSAHTLFLMKLMQEQLVLSLSLYITSHSTSYDTVPNGRVQEFNEQ